MYQFSVPVATESRFDRENLLKILKRCGTSRIVLTLFRRLEYRFSAPETLQMLKENLDFFRKNGVETAVWIGETLGHDQAGGFADGDETPYRRMKLPNLETVASFCPTDENFKNDLCGWLESVAKLGPDLILIDDDFCLYGGCVCAAHLTEIQAELKEEISAEDLVKKVFSGKENRYRAAWMKVQGESLYRLAHALREAVDRVDPAIRMGLCCESHHWDSCGISLPKLVRIFAGNTKPLLRTAGAPYHSRIDHATSLGTSAELERSQAQWCKEEGFELLSEGDTYPRPRFSCPAAYLECFDQILQADGSFDGILKYTMDYFSDEEYESGYSDAWIKNLPLCREIQSAFAGKRAIGITPWLAAHTAEKAEMEFSDKLRLSRWCSGFYSPAAELAVQNNLPTAYGEGEGALILFGENARSIPKNELKRGCIIDLAAATILQERGIDVGIESVSLPPDVPHNLWTAAEQYFAEESRYVRVSGAVLPHRVTYKEGAEILTEFQMSGLAVSGWTRYENADGMRFLILPFQAKELMGDHQHKAGHLNGYLLRRMLLRQIEWLNRSPLEVYAEGKHPLLYTLAKKGEGSLAVGLWNLFEDRIDGLEVRINGDYKNLRFVNCTGEKTASGVRITSPLFPYEFAGIELF
ncbi:MAG: hypothetical protein J6C26_05170 [Clostridia bacterium]|nr:hypothetical protein [Clostridia bacterium]